MRQFVSLMEHQAWFGEDGRQPCKKCGGWGITRTEENGIKRVVGGCGACWNGDECVRSTSSEHGTPVYTDSYTAYLEWFRGGEEKLLRLRIRRAKLKKTN